MKAFIIGIAIHFVVWTYPLVDEGGMQNVAFFFLWAAAIIALIASIISMIVDPGEPEYELSKPTKAILRVSFWCGMAWLIYHGLFALPAVFIIGSIFAFIGRKIHEPSGAV